MTSFTQLLEGVSPTAAGHMATIPPDWMQGRSTYGGLSTALCYAAATQGQDLPPLRTAMVTFVGPSGGTVDLSAKTLRAGRSVVYRQADLAADGQLGTTVVFAFGKGRPSALNEFALPTPGGLPAPAEAPPLIPEGAGPIFAQHFDATLAKGGHPVSASDALEHFIWVRHKDKGATGMAGLLAIADMPPPAVLPRFQQMVPLSSVTWMINILNDELATSYDGWWLMRSAAESAAEGYSSQDMQVWTEDGTPVISAKQCVAVFG